MDAVPSARRVRVSRLANIADDRLWRRLGFLRAHLRVLARACDGRNEMRVIARELLLITRELDQRGVPHA